MTTTATEPDVVEQVADGTEYVILERAEVVNVQSAPAQTGWVERGTETARSATQALKQHLAGQSDVDSVFVATPARSWNPVPVKTRIALDFGDAS